MLDITFDNTDGTGLTTNLSQVREPTKKKCYKYIPKVEVEDFLKSLSKTKATTFSQELGFYLLDGKESRTEAQRQIKHVCLTPTICISTRHLLCKSYFKVAEDLDSIIKVHPFLRVQGPN